MRHLRAALLTMTFVLVPLPGLASDEIPISELLEMASELAGEEVTLQGELVGDYGNRNDGWTWTQVNDDAYVDEPIREGGTPQGANIGVGARIPTELTSELDPPGGYRNRGPVVRLTGTWKYHDAERQGESYLQVETVTVVEQGRQLQNQVDLTPVILGGFLLACAGVIALITTLDRRLRGGG